MPITMKESVVVDGRTWRMFDVEFKSEGSTYSVYLYALNKEHASYMLADLKATGKLADGEIIETWDKK